MISLFNKSIDIFAPIDGNLMTLEEVNDGVFSTKILGDGFAIKPTNNIITSPIKAVVTSIFPTKHAISLKTNKGVECLIHMGIDTVNLNGLPFSILTNLGDKVDNKTPLASINLEILKEKNINDTILVIFTNSSEKNNELIINTKGKVTQNKKIGYYS